MRVARTLPELTQHCAALRAAHGRIGLVPTMGALHAGHRALVDTAVRSGAGVVVSVFVNPSQFGSTADFQGYPRDDAGDLAILEDAGCHLAWVPEVATMYPPDDATVIEVGGPALRWEGTHRPGHFRGMATVVAKLFGQVRPDLAYFGEKDWQQVQVVRRMVADLHLPPEIVAIPTVREPDGLALSSRNRLLTPEARRVAPLMHGLLREADQALAEGATASGPLAAALERLREAGFSPDYFALVDGETLEPLEGVRPGARLIAAASLGTVRLIDNIAAG